MAEKTVRRIIIEGPDCSGKSTLVNRLKNALKWDSKSLHHSKGNQFIRYLREYSNNENIIFDRAHFSEIVYSMMWRGGNPFSDMELRILNDFVRNNTLVIFTCPPIELLEKRHASRDFEQEIKLPELKYSRRLFSEVLESIPHIAYKSEDYGELNKLISNVEEIIMEKKRLKFYLAGPVGYGSPGIEWKQEMKDILRSYNHEVYDPIENDDKYPEIPKMNILKENPKEHYKEIKRIMKTVFIDDCEFITNCDYVICYFTGRALGTASEQGIAYYLNKFLNKNVKTISIIDESFKPDEWVLCCSDHVFFSIKECNEFLAECMQ